MSYDEDPNSFDKKIKEAVNLAYQQGREDGKQKKHSSSEELEQLARDVFNTVKDEEGEVVAKLYITPDGNLHPDSWISTQDE